MTSFNPDGSVHQLDARLGEYTDPAELRSTAQAVPALGVYHAGLLVFNRPGIASAYGMYRSRAALTVLSVLVVIRTAWTAAGAAHLALGSAATPTWFETDLIGASGIVPSGWGLLAIGGASGPLIVSVDGSPSAGEANIYLIGTAGLVYPASFDPITEGYAG